MRRLVEIVLQLRLLVLVGRKGFRLRRFGGGRRRRLRCA
jgi:hypothetical protein